MADELPESQAFLSWGRWVTGCGWTGCGNAKEVSPGQEHLICDAPPKNEGACLRTTVIAWPGNVAERAARVSDLPVQERSDVVPGSPQDGAPPAEEASDDPVQPASEDQP